jgi:hypothetical protein
MGKFDPGAVYIIGEVDQLTGKHSDYYKIGLVGPTRTVEDRIERDHQTGNPRKIIDVHSFDTVAPHFVERHLHLHYASKRIFREWCKFTQQELQDVIAEAARYDAAISPKVAAVRPFTLSESNGQAASLTTTQQKEATKIHNELVKIEIGLQELMYMKSIITNEFKLATDKHEGGIDGITEVTIKGQGEPEFKKNIFRDSGPANRTIHDQFMTKRSIKDREKLVCTHSTTKSKNHPALHAQEKQAIDDYTAEKAEVGNTVAGVVARTTVLADKHEKYIEIIEGIEELTTRQLACQLGLMHLCESNERIEGICKWKRTEKIEFDETAFKRAHPALYFDPQYHAPSAPSVSIKVLRARNYV